MGEDPENESRQDDEPAVPPRPPGYPTIGTVNVERGENPDMPDPYPTIGLVEAPRGENPGDAE